jgi:hypothetical protein
VTDGRCVLFKMDTQDFGFLALPINNLDSMTPFFSIRHDSNYIIIIILLVAIIALW